MMGATFFAKLERLADRVAMGGSGTLKPWSSAEYNIVLYGFIELIIG
jgi:hypothetical protein